MVEERTHIIELLRQFANSISAEFSISKVLLYGSYAKDSANEFSDIDVAVIFNQDENTDKISATKKLYKTALKINPKIEPRCFFYNETINAEPASILNEIIRTGLVIS